MINYAKEAGLQAVFFPFDTTRARPEDLENLCKGIVDQSMPDSICIVDTVGCATPEAIKYMVRWVKQMTGLPIEVHTHNDFGLGVATELAAVSAGAQVVHSGGNGLGERTGNAALEELAMALHILYGYDTPYQLDKLVSLGDLISREANVPIARNKPVLGASNFTRETGVAINFIMDDPLVMFGTHPQLNARSGEVVLGKKSGKASVAYKLNEMKLGNANDSELLEMLEAVKRRGTAKRDVLTDDEFRDIAMSILTKDG